MYVCVSFFVSSSTKSSSYLFFATNCQISKQVKPPKDRLIKDFTLNWRPNSDIVYVFETQQSGFFGPILGMFEKQTVTHNKMFLYRQVGRNKYALDR